MGSCHICGWLRWSSWLLSFIRSSSGFVAIWRVNHRMEDLSLPFNFKNLCVIEVKTLCWDWCCGKAGLNCHPWHQHPQTWEAFQNPAAPFLFSSLLTWRWKGPRRWHPAWPLHPWGWCKCSSFLGLAQLWLRVHLRSESNRRKILLSFSATLSSKLLSLSTKKVFILIQNYFWNPCIVLSSHAFLWVFQRLMVSDNGFSKYIISQTLARTRK